ncbi:unnamed protein product [Closterium sp. NIES-65]|nr:unnamed protein product [Closterium sp. NIES-65]
MLHHSVAGKPLASVPVAGLVASSAPYTARPGTGKAGGIGLVGSSERARGTRRDLSGVLVGWRRLDRALSRRSISASGGVVVAATAGAADRASGGEMDSAERPVKMTLHRPESRPPQSRPSSHRALSPIAPSPPSRPLPNCALSPFAPSPQLRALPIRALPHRALPNRAPSCLPPPPSSPVVEHVALFNMPADMAEESEGDMLSHLYSLQYHYPHLLAISLGRIQPTKRPVGFSHALFARFPSRQALDGFLALPALAAAMEQFVTPSCTDTLSLSYEAQVEADIESVFRRGDAYERGVDHVVLLRAKPAAEADKQSAMVAALAALPLVMEPHILVQLTAGANFAVDTAKGFTHGLVARFPSEAALDAYNKHPSHRQVLQQHVLPLSEAILAVDFHVDPVGREEKI